MPCALVISAFFLTRHSAQAQTHTLLASESFDYTADMPMRTLNGGTGWSSAWQSSITPGFLITSDNALPYPNLIHRPEHLLVGIGQSAGRRLNLHTEGSFAPYLSSGLIGASGTTIYVSALLRNLQNNDHAILVALHNANDVLSNAASNQKISMGYLGSASNSGGIKYWSIRIGTETIRTPV